MKLSKMKIAAVLAWIIGVMAVVAGARVLSGKLPDYTVIDWLPVYNFVMGVITVLATAVFIWKNSRYAMLAAGATFSAHTVVMLILLTAFRTIVAFDSLVAMTVRMLVWIVILALLYSATKTGFQKRAVNV